METGRTLLSTIIIQNFFLLYVRDTLQKAFIYELGAPLRKSKESCFGEINPGPTQSCPWLRVS